MRRCLESLRGVAHTEVRRLVVALGDVAASERVDRAYALAPFGIDTTGVELFELERRARQVYSLTAADDPTPAAERSASVTVDAAPAVSRSAPAPTPPSTPRSAAAAVPASDARHVTPPTAEAARVPAPPALPAPHVRTPLVSVIVPTHDRPATLRVALESILAQTFRDFEIVVVNDAGADVQHVIDGLAHEGRISYVRHAVNRGLAAARNSGIGVARGRYVAYLDDDDRFFPEHLAILVEALERGPERAVYSDALRVVQLRDGDGYKTVGREVPYSNDFDRCRLLVLNQFPVLCMMHERACLDRVGRFDESMTSHEDWELWLRLSAAFPFRHLKNVTCEFTHRVDGSSMTSSMRPDYLRTAEVIYARTAADAAPFAEVLQARERFLANLRASVAATPAASAATGPTPPRVAPPGAPQFDCSIIIPVFNRVELTEQCLTKFVETTSGASFEVIVVDNASTDGTAAFLAKLGGDVRIVRNTENRGFAAACNQGARVARGRHLVFLNNDTIPLPGWLAPLIAELDGDPEIAVVGSKLLFPDDTIQHAGVAFTRDAMLPFHLFYRVPANLPVVNRRRELQCVTGACMAVRRSVFDALGGFDEGYRNGYEDVDFCLQVADRGGRIVYQPASALYHLESQTPGRKAHDDHNGRRLLERWGARWQRFGDEDLVLVPEGWCIRTDASGRKLMARITDDAERARWEHVARAQKALRANDAASLRDVLGTVADWPDDPSVRSWVERLHELVGLPRATRLSAAHA